MTDLAIYQKINEKFYDDQLQSVNPLRRWFHANRYKIINNFVHSFYAPSMKIVDVGAGSCCWNKDKLPVFGIDCNEQLLQYGTDQGRLQGYKVADIHQTGIRDTDFDIAVATEVLEHFGEVDCVVKEVYRMLKPGGTFIISVPYDQGFSLWKTFFFLQTIYKGFLKGDEYYKKQCGHVQHFSLESLKTLLERQGFSVETGFSVWRFSIFVVARRHDD